MKIKISPDVVAVSGVSRNGKEMAAYAITFLSLGFLALSL